MREGDPRYLTQRNLRTGRGADEHPTHLLDVVAEVSLIADIDGIALASLDVLGNIDLLEWYNLDLGVRILHMLLMSWGGEVADEDETAKEMAGMQKEIRRTVAEVRRAGIDQMDVRSPNLLWNREAQRVMLIDFKRAIEIKARDDRTDKERAMQEISGD